MRTTSPPNSEDASLVVGVVVRVDQVGDLVGEAVGGGDLVTARRMLWPMFGGASKITTPVGGGQERRHVDVVGDRVEVPLDLPDVVPVLVQAGPFATAGREAYSGRL